ncbi:hypothetical protein ACFQL1_15775 [Halomicroarcula sp. GCM10025709]|uniref:hypothetical protein n=1 Tax=Haloarcula TaxID=2237 RepID=UPI0024C38F81|nr:hypothetical protein [Halomicroarcula sp. YJ-61-S]
MSRSSYSGDPLDGTVQYITERPELDDGETVDVVDDRLDAQGEESVENVPIPKDELDKPDVDGQMKLSDFKEGCG